MSIHFTPIPTDIAQAYQFGGLDANAQVPEVHLSDGGGNPCRHCLKMIPKGTQMLVLAHRPFPTPQPYAEVGPIFLCATSCEAGGGSRLPEILASTSYILRGYGADDRIIYGTGAVVAKYQLKDAAAAQFAREDVVYLHLRSATNNCFQLRIDRA